MSLQMFERQYHKERKARRALEQNISPFFGWGRYKDDNFPRKVPIRLTEVRPIFATEQEAVQWAQNHPLGTHYEVVRYCGNREPGKGFIAYLYERRGAPFRTPSRTWEVEEQEVAEQWAIVMRKVEQRGFQGGVKRYGRKYRRRKRQYGRQASRLYLQGDFDRGDAIDLHVGDRGILWDIW